MHDLIRKEILHLAGQINSKRETEVFKSAFPSKLWHESLKMRRNLAVRQPEKVCVARSNNATAKQNQERIF